MKLLTTNCRGASHHTTLRKVLQEAKKSNSVISVLTETKLKQIDNHYLRKNWGEYLNTPHVFSDTDDEGHRKAGLAICFRLGSLEEINKVIPSGVGRHIVMSAKIEGFQYTIIGVYGNDQSDRESLLSFQHLQRDIATVTTEFPCENTIMLGDFNCILHTADSLRGIINKPRTARKLTEIIEDLNMVDVWEHSSHPDDEHFTYGQFFFDNNNCLVTKKASRLDRIYATPGLLHFPTANLLHGIRNYADHLQITAELKTAIRDPPTYRFPDELLQSSHYLSFLHSTVRDFLAIHSTAAEAYISNTPAAPDPAPNYIILETIEKISEGTDEELNNIELNRIPLVYSSNLDSIFIDKSTAFKKAKLEEMYANESRQSTNPNIKSIDDICNNFKFKDEPESVLYSLFQTITEATKQYKNARKSSIVDEIKSLMNKIKKLQIRQMKSPNVSRKDEIELLTTKISILEATNAATNLRNVRVNASAYDKKSNSKFLRQTKINKSSANIHKIVETKNGQDIEHIGDDATDFMQNKFKELFSSPSLTDHNCTIEDFLGEEINKIKKLPEVVVQMLLTEITVDELTEQVFKSHAGSAPGYSGITHPLIQHIWPIIKNLFLDFTKSVMAKGKLPTWAELRKTIVIPKPGKDRCNADSYRPIALLEIAYKIISGCFAERLKIAMPYIIGYSQKGFMAGRSAQDAVRGILDARDLSVRQRRPSILMGLDLSKAFDTVSHEFLFNAMRLMGFPEDFIKNIKILIGSPTIRCYINGRLSEEYQSIDGTGQGDPISSFLFSIAIEIFLIKLSFSSDIKRFILNVETNTEMLPEAFADDINALLKATKDAIDNILTVASDFAKISGLQLSNSKTELMIIGPDNGLTKYESCQMH